MSEEHLDVAKGRSMTHSFSDICQEAPSDYFADANQSNFSSSVAHARCDSAFLGVPEDVKSALFGSQVKELMVRKNDGYACLRTPGGKRSVKVNEGSKATTTPSASSSSDYKLTGGESNSSLPATRASADSSAQNEE